MKRFASSILSGLLLLCSLALSGCDTWESTTFKTLSASKAVIDQAHKDYESGVIPKNPCAYTLINQAIAADSLADTAFRVYVQEKQSNAAATVLADQQAIVAEQLLQIAPLVSDVALLKSNPIAACAGVKQ